MTSVLPSLLETPLETLLAPRRTPFFCDLRAHGDAVAVVTDEVTLTYAELADRVDAAAEQLGSTRRLVLVPGANDLPTLTWYLAALRTGHAVLLLPGTSTAHLRSWTLAYDPDVVVSGKGLQERREGTAHDLHPDLALVLATSGSTGSRKLVRLSYDNLDCNARAIAEYLHIAATDRAITTLPMHYCYGLSVVHSNLAAGAGIVLTDRSVVDPQFWHLAREAAVTSLAGVPYTFELLDRAGFPEMTLPSLRYLTQAGGRLAPETVRRYAELGSAAGWRLYVMYGQTEATARMAYLPPQLAADFPDAIGTPVPGGSIRLEAVPGTPHDGTSSGEIVYSGPNVMMGYATCREDLAVGHELTELHTGDLARRNSAGLFEIVGRRGRFAKVYGLRIDLPAVDAALERAGIGGCAVPGDDELVVAVERDADLGPARRRAAAVSGLPGRRVRVVRVPSLPRTDNGKIDLSAVEALTREPGREQQKQGPACDLRALYSDVLDRPDVTDDDTFAGLGGDSLSYVEMSVRLEDALGTLPPDWPTTRIGDLRPEASVQEPLPGRRTRTVETAVVVRATAIVLIVGSHANVFSLLGAAHVLLAALGYGFARFFLPADTRQERTTRILRAAGRLAAPSMVWIAGAYALTSTYSLANVFLLNTVVGPDRWGPTWHFWFLEAALYLLLAMAALLAVPALDRAERRHPVGFPAALLAGALVPRFAYDVATYGIETIHRPHTVLWLFVLGWLIARATSVRHRLALTGVVALAVPGLSGAPLRDALLAAGLLALVWVPSVRVPHRLAQVLTVLAASSLFIYLTHWQVYPHLENRWPGLALLASLAAGVAYARLWSWISARVPALAPSRRS